MLLGYTRYIPVLPLLFISVFLKNWMSLVMCTSIGDCWTHQKECLWPPYRLGPLDITFLIAYWYLFVCLIAIMQLWSLWVSSLILSLWRSMEWSLTMRPWTLSTLLRGKNRYESSSDEWTLTAFDVIVNCLSTNFNFVRWEQIVAVKKIHWGDPREKICEAIDNIPLSCLIIGNRGLGKLKR